MSDSCSSSDESSEADIIIKSIPKMSKNQPAIKHIIETRQDIQKGKNLICNKIYKDKYKKWLILTYNKIDLENANVTCAREIKTNKKELQNVKSSEMAKHNSRKYNFLKRRQWIKIIKMLNY